MAAGTKADPISDMPREMTAPGALKEFITSTPAALGKKWERLPIYLTGPTTASGTCWTVRPNGIKFWTASDSQKRREKSIRLT